MALREVHITDLYPLELHYIKALCAHQRYRECIQACREYLHRKDHSSAGDTFQQVFVSFYLGLAHEELARMMHHQSHSKVPAFDQAEKYYQNALSSLHNATLVKATGAIYTQSAVKKRTNSGSKAPSLPQDCVTRRSLEEPHFEPPKALSSSRNHAPPPLASCSRDSSVSDVSEHSSDDDTHKLAKACRQLERSVSSMHLLEAPPAAQLCINSKCMPLQRDTSSMSLLNIQAQPKLPRSVSHSLLRPIRLGSPPKQYHVPPKPVRSRDPLSRMPQQFDRNLPQSPSKQRITLSSLAEEDAEPAMMVPDKGVAESFTLPTTPPRPPKANPSSSRTSSPAAAATGQTRGYEGLQEHVAAMRSQIETHLNMLAQIKQQTLAYQAEIETHRIPALLKGSSMGGAKVTEKQHCINEGRERMWQRERFQPQKYRDLAELALAEL